MLGLWAATALTTSDLERHLKEIGRDLSIQSDSTIRSAAAVRAMGMERGTLKRWRERFGDLLNVNDQILRRHAWIQGTSRFVRTALQVITLAVGCWHALDGSINAGLIIAASIVSARVVGPIEVAAAAWGPLMSARQAFWRLRRYLGRATLEVESTACVPVVSRLDAEKLVLVPRGRAEALIKGVSISVKPGMLLGVCGPPGSGKSTLAALLAGALDATSGTVSLDGREIRSLDRSVIGYLGQDQELLPGTVYENITRFEPSSRPELVAEALAAAGAEALVAALPRGQATEVGPSQPSLSPGQRHRVLLARAFYGHPKLLVLDEPAAFLDPEGERALVSALQSAKDRNGAIVVVAPRGAVVPLVDVMLVMRDGRVEMISHSDKTLQNSAGVKVVSSHRAPVRQYARG
jgi:ABC-type protease/lipase transport system fused ATPase/permease subunit